MENMDIIEIDFVLKRDDIGNEILECNLENDTFRLDFTSENQDYLRRFFMATIKLLQKGQFHFKYKKADNFSNTLLEEVADEYVTQLNLELDSIYSGLINLNSLKIDNN